MLLGFWLLAHGNIGRHFYRCVLPAHAFVLQVNARKLSISLRKTYSCIGIFEACESLGTSLKRCDLVSATQANLGSQFGSARQHTKGRPAVSHEEGGRRGG